MDSTGQIAMLLAQCGAEPGATLLPAGLFAAGLMGGFTHCAGMCGPIVLAQVGARLEKVPARAMTEWHRLTGAALLSYHFGRATTYAGLGALAGLAAGRIGEMPGLRPLSAILLLAAALSMLAMALPGLRRLLKGPKDAAPPWAGALLALAAPLLSATGALKGYALGLLLGFLPCGMLYAALVAAAAAGGAWQGGLAMAAFAAGTMPPLIGIGLAGHMAGARFRKLAAWLVPLLLILNAGILAMLALKQIA